MLVPDLNNPITFSALYPINDKEYSHLEIVNNIQKPFYIYDVDYDHKKFVKKIFITTHKKNVFSCPICNEPHCKIHSYVPRKVRTIDSQNYQTYLIYKKPRVKCSKCGSVTAIKLPLETPRSSLSTIYEARIIALAIDMPCSAVAKSTGLTDKHISNIINRSVTKSRQNLDYSDVAELGIDETSSAKRHKYISVFVNMENNSVLFATPGKDSSVLKTFSSELTAKHGNPNYITEVAADMSPAFTAGVKTSFPNAHITYDKFHLIKNMNEVLDTVRREETKETPVLKGTRFIWLHNPNNLTSKQQDILSKLSKQRFKTGRAYRFKLTLQSIYKNNTDVIDAEIQFKRLISWGLHSRLEPLINFAKTMRSHLDGILRFFKSGLTSGRVEGINAKIQEIKRRSKGFGNTDHFINMIYLVLGKLPIPKLFGTGLPTSY
jgi:transposase